MCCCSSTTTPSGTFCLSPCAHTRMRAAVCCLHDVLGAEYVFAEYVFGCGVRCCSSTTTQPGACCLSPCAHTRIRAAVCCLLGVLCIYMGAACTATPLGAACAAPPPRRRNRVLLVRRRARIHACEQLCVVSVMFCVHIWGQHVCAAAPP